MKPNNNNKNKRTITITTTTTTTTTTSTTNSASDLLHKAVREKRLDLLTELLARSDINVNHKDSFGNTPLHFACLDGSFKIVEKLLSKSGINVDATDPFNRTPLSHAAKNGHLNCVKQLILHGCNCNSLNNKSETPLMKAIQNKQEEVALELIRAGASVTIQEQTYNNTPLHVAARNGLTSVVSSILKRNNKTVNALNIRKRTPLHNAAAGGSLQCCILLIQNGAKLLKDDKGNGPVEYARTKEIAFEIKRCYHDMVLEQLKKRNVADWSCEDVADWICALGFENYLDNFQMNNVDGKILKTLTIRKLEEDLKISSNDKVQIKKLIDIFVEIEMDKTDKRILPPLDFDSHEFEIDYNELEFHECLGKGNFGEVNRATWKRTEVAVKKIYRASFRNQTDVAMFYKEVAILRQLRHPNIIMFLGVATDGLQYCLVTELVSNGSLRKMIKENFSELENSPSLRSMIVNGIVSGMEYLHSIKPSPIVHRDLSTPNILIAADRTVKIADFGLSRKMDNIYDLTTQVGCLPFMAPEVYKLQPYDLKVDVYSFGVCLYELWSGKEPNFGFKEPKEYAEVVATNGYRPHHTNDIPKFWLQIICACWHEDPAMRPSFKEIQNMLEQEHQPSSRLSGSDEQSNPLQLDDSNYVVAYYIDS